MKKWLIVLICLLMVGCTPKVSIKPDYNFLQIRRVTVLPFEPRGNPWSQFYTDYFISELVKIDKFEVIEKARLNKTMEAQLLDKNTPIDFTLLQEIGKALNVDAVFVGSCVKRAGAFVNVRLIDLRTGKIIWSGVSSNMKKLIKPLKELP